MANPLTLLMPLAENVNIAEIAATLHASQPQIDQALTTVGTVHFARFVLLDRSAPNLQPNSTAPGAGPFVLGVMTEYDGDFTVYIQDFVNQLGPIFDALLKFTADGADLVPVSQHVQAFTAYIAANDASQHAPNQTLYSAYAATVQQVLANA